MPHVKLYVPALERGELDGLRTACQVLEEAEVLRLDLGQAAAALSERDLGRERRPSARSRSGRRSPSTGRRRSSGRHRRPRPAWRPSVPPPPQQPPPPAIPACACAFGSTEPGRLRRGRAAAAAACRGRPRNRPTGPGTAAAVFALRAWAKRYDPKNATSTISAITTHRVWRDAELAVLLVLLIFAILSLRPRGSAAWCLSLVGRSRRTRARR